MQELRRSYTYSIRLNIGLRGGPNFHTARTSLKSGDLPVEFEPT